MTLYVPDLVGLVAMTIAGLLAWNYVSDPVALAQFWMSMGGAVVVLAAFRIALHHLGENHRLHRTADWWIVLAALPLYLGLPTLANALNRPLMDDVLIHFDDTLFGVQPAVWLSSHMVRALSEYLYLCYASYYVWVAVTGILIARSNNRRALLAYTTAIGLTFFLMVLGYLSVPAVGPRFSLASQMAQPIVGAWWAESLDNSYRHVPYLRDCFPSGHTLQTLVAIVFSWRYLSRRYAAFMTVVGASIIFSTLYLRMHYAVDLLAALPFAVFGISAAELWTRQLRRGVTLDLQVVPKEVFRALRLR